MNKYFSKIVVSFHITNYIKKTIYEKTKLYKNLFDLVNMLKTLFNESNNSEITFDTNNIHIYNYSIDLKNTNLSYVQNINLSCVKNINNKKLYSKYCINKQNNFNNIISYKIIRNNNYNNTLDYNHIKIVIIDSKLCDETTYNTGSGKLPWKVKYLIPNIKPTFYITDMVLENLNDCKNFVIDELGNCLGLSHACDNNLTHDHNHDTTNDTTHFTCYQINRIKYFLKRWYNFN